VSGTFVRGAVLRLTEHPFVRRVVTEHAIGRRVATRFVAGETLADVLGVAEDLRAQGLTTMLDHLGENVRTPEHAADAANAYVRALEAIGAAEELNAAISVKLTQLGLDLSEELCRAHLERLVSTADRVGRLVMIDMESSVYVDRTLETFRAFRARTGRIGVCLQACLRRTPEDVFALPEASIVRLVKGAYLEPAELVLTGRRDVDRAFSRLAATILGRGHVLHAATHDPKLVDGLLRRMRDGSVPVDPGSARVEFQMLYGIRRDLQLRLAAEGAPVRVYVPYGVEWYPYLTRRLAERPANVWFFLSNLLRSGR
jgi:proline dehydrogenase